MPRPATGVPASSLGALRDAMNTALKKARYGEYKEAIEQLDHVYRLAVENPDAVAQDPTAPVWLTKVLVNAAFAHNRLGGDSDAVRQLLLEQIRSFPEVAVTSEDYGPEMAKLYASAKSSSDREPRNRLVVKVSRPDAEIFINGAPRGRAMFAGDLLPGAYHVLVRVGSEARRYDVAVEVPPRPATGLNIDWDLDRHIHASEDWVGALGTGNRSESLVKWLAKRLPKNDRAIVVTIAQHDGHRYLAGFAASASGETRTTCAEQLAEPASAAASRTSAAELADCLTGDAPSRHGTPTFDASAATSLPASVVTKKQPTDENPSPRPSPPRAAHDRWGLYTGIVGAAMLGTGLYLYHRTYSAHDDDPSLLSGTLMFVGAAGTGVGLGWLLIKLDSRRGGAGLSISPTSSGGTVSFVGRF
ncbi:MAG TPA: hypothetical protein VGM90_16340 [Kofleriaceae bacterium]